MKHKMFFFVFAILIILSLMPVRSWSPYLNDNILAYFRFDETSGTVAKDGVRGVYNGTIVGTPSLNTVGQIKTTYSLTGTQYTNLTKPTYACVFDKNCSVSVWMNTSTIGRNFYYAGNASLDNYIALTTESATGRLLFQFDNSAGTLKNVFTNINVTTGSFVHIGMALNTTSVLLYVNGTFVNQSIISGNFVPNLNNVKNLEMFGGGDAPEGSAPFIGKLDEAGVWNRTLNSSDFNTIYLQGLNGVGFSNDAFSNITLFAPPNNTIVAHNNITFLSNISGTMNSTNNTIFVFYSNGSVANILNNQTTNTVNPIYNISLSGGDYLWAMRTCSSSPDGSAHCFNTDNRTVSSGFSVIDEYWKNNSGEGDSALFQINISVAQGKTLASGVINYNFTDYPATVTSLGGDNYSLSKIVPSGNLVSNSNIPFFWNMTLASTPGTFVSNVHTQSVSIIALDICSATNVYTILNYSVRDEDNNQYLNGLANSANVSIDANLYTIGTLTLVAQFNHTFLIVNATTPARVCITGEILNTTSYRLDSTASYISTAHVLEYHNIQNHTLTNNTIFNDISLLDLAVTRAQQFLITFKDSNFIPLADALIRIDRQYLGDGVFRTVEIPKTDNDGRTVGNFVLNDEVYTIYVYKNGVLLATFPNQRAFCSNIATGDCRINLNAQGSGNQFTGVSSLYNVTYSLSYIQSTRTVQLIYSTTDGTSKFIELNATINDNFLNQTACSSSTTGTSGTTSCSIPASFGNVSIRVQAFADGNLLTTSIFDMDRIKEFIRSSGTYLIAFLLIITLPLLAITSGSMTIIFFFIGLMMAGFLVLINLGGFVGAMSAFLWFVVAGSILLWKMNRSDT